MNYLQNPPVWLRVVVFFILAVALSSPLRFYWILLDPSGTWPVELAILKNALDSIGPFVGAWLLIPWARLDKTMSWGGTQPGYSLLMGLCFVGAFVMLGYPNSYGLSPAYYGFWFSIMLLLYAYGEEYGWRGYLQQELAFVSPVWQYVLVGTIWYLWHLNFLKNPDLSGNLVFWAICVLASWGIGQIALRTYSIIACACFHLIGNLLGISQTISETLPIVTGSIVIGGCVFIWVFLVIRWSPQQN